MSAKHNNKNSLENMLKTEQQKTAKSTEYACVQIQNKELL
jgi:hypothetical protein